jgi:hypothetical protein
MMKLELIDKNTNFVKVKIFILDQNEYIRNLKYEAARHILELTVKDLTEEEDLYEILDSEELTDDDMDYILDSFIPVDYCDLDIFSDKPYITIL